MMYEDFIERQLAEWPEARERYLALGKTQRRRFRLGDFEGAFQHNPARAVSTAAAVDAAAIAARPCFLCAANRPPEQIALPINKEWEMLVNPFPIFPVHFTIASTVHKPQTAPPLEMAGMAEHFPDLVFFFNGARAGASAPDHLHLQAVLQSELPLLRIAEANHPADKPGIMRSDMWGLNLPFLFLSALITDDEEGGRDYLKMLAYTGGDADGNPDRGLRNVFCWKGSDGLLRMIVIPRQRHRPSCYPGQGASSEGLLVSPGAVDMAGIVILPRLQDFNTITEEQLKQIYQEV